MNRPAQARLVPVLIAVAALVLAGLMSPANAATKSGSIAGVVTVDGQPIRFAKVQIFKYLPDDGSDEFRVGPRVKTDNTDGAGRYSFSGLSTSKDHRAYAVLVTDRTSSTVKTYRDVIAKAGKTVKQNFRMKRSATLTGTIATSDGRSPAGLKVETEPGVVNDIGPTHDKLFPVFSTTVRADGTFTLTGIPSSTEYDQIRVSDGPAALQCYDFVAGTLTDCATKSNQSPEYYARQRLDLATGEQRTLPAVTMSRFAPPVTRATGRVTDTSGRAIKGIVVSISSDDGGASATTRSSGRFTVKGVLPAGTYRVRFTDRKYVHASQYLANASGGRFTLTPGQDVAGLDARLKSTAVSKVAVKGGDGTAKIAVRITRSASGSGPSGTLTLTSGDVTKTVKVSKGSATAKLRGLRKGNRKVVLVYSGTSSTAGFSKTVRVSVR